MSLLLFSRNNTLFESPEKGSITGIYIPFHDQVKNYSDISQPSTNAVRERHGGVGSTPLWRMEGSSVGVYGVMPPSLMARRQGISVWLPQDFVKRDTEVFYFVFGKKWVIHGVKVRNDEGKEHWGISRIECSGTDGIIETINNSISDRMLEGVAEKIIVAVYRDDSTLNKLNKSLKPLGIGAVSFDTLSLISTATPLYKHRDFSLLMLTFALFALLVLVGSVAFLFLNKTKLDRMKREVAQLEEQIRQQHADRPLGHIRNPNNVLKAMANREEQMPSALMHAAGEATASFGTLNKVIYDSTKRQGDYLHMQAELKDVENDLLLYQEEVARSVLKSRPWISQIERTTARNPKLSIKIKVE